MSASKLVKPDVRYKDSYLNAIQEWHEEGRYKFLSVDTLSHSFDQFVEDLNTGKRHLHKPYPDWVEPVSETVLWLIREDKFIGTINIRHRLNWHLEKWGGHVNFIIRPTMRNKGFGKKILRKGIPFICHIGIEKALITVAPDNDAAIKIVEFCGAVFQDETPETNQFPARRRYWLECS